jgi:GT2 family glycosyltransferase
MSVGNTTVSIVVLTYCRPEEITRNVASLLKLRYDPLEIVVVDNASDVIVADLLPQDSRLRVLRMDENKGIAGRNHGVLAATGDVVITLDDDVTGLSDQSIELIVEALAVPQVAAVNFRILDEVTGEITNWCHHRVPEKYADGQFDTYEISEGAVALRRQAFIDAGLYPEFFFISHEGPDLAIRLMDMGYRVVYNGKITVLHSHCQIARVSWRRYYYDTRNQIWLVVRHLPASMALRKLVIGLGAMFVYALRDGFIRYWFKGVYHAVEGLPEVVRNRKCISASTLLRYHELERSNPGWTYMLSKRLFRRKIGI